MKKWSLVLLIFVICGAAAQLIRPTIGNPPVTADISAPPQVEQVLRRACYDCHSNQTRLSWFDRITPADFLVAGHIRRGRKALNFSHWDSLTKDQRLGKLYEALNQATFDVMPLADYARFHPAAKISGQDLEILKNYLVSITPVTAPDSANSAKEAASDAQYARWIATAVQGAVPSADLSAAPSTAPSAVPSTASSAAPSGSVRPVLNGITFQADFKNWQVISTTERFDNASLRVILGNDITVRAIKEQQTNPWPDGAVFAKPAWRQVVDSTGKIHPGELYQVEFMVRDKKKYASTDGWGFARWIKGLDLVPYGKTVLYQTECTNCHKPMRGNDFVFTIPTRPLEGRVITSGVDRRNKTMFTLYGNDAATSAARTGRGHPYPAGSALSLVTWVQREDPHWFGGNIPDHVESVEKVTFKAEAGGRVLPVYESNGQAPGPESERLAFILNQRACVLP